MTKYKNKQDFVILALLLFDTVVALCVKFFPVAIILGIATVIQIIHIIKMYKIYKHKRMLDSFTTRL